jgi:hypothetical protein
MTERVTRDDLLAAAEWLGAYEVGRENDVTIADGGACGDDFAEQLLRVRAWLFAETERRDIASQAARVAKLAAEKYGVPLDADLRARARQKVRQAREATR